MICEAVQSNKETKLASLNVGRNEIGPAGAKSVAAMAAVIASLTVTDMRYNNLDTESATMLATVAKEKGISLCGIKPDQTLANFSFNGLQPPDAVLLASDLSKAGVSASLTSVCTLA